MFKWLTGHSGQAKPSPNPTTSAKPAKPSFLNPFFQWLSQETGLGAERFLTDEAINHLEETLLQADVSMDTAMAISKTLQAQRQQIQSPEDLKRALQDIFLQSLSSASSPSVSQELVFTPGKCNIYLIVGVNGAGKTTLIGKLAHRFTQAGKTVLIGAGDTFRAAAEDQLAIWAKRAEAHLVQKPGTDPASVIYETLTQAKDPIDGKPVDVVILDTAGRLQNKLNLMAELQKIRGVIEKAAPTNHQLETLLVIDATTGQNGLRQAAVFKEAVALTGIALTKLDGSAKGGIVLSIAQEYGLPVKLVGIGEGIEDLIDFDPETFVAGLFQGA